MLKTVYVTHRVFSDQLIEQYFSQPAAIALPVEILAFSLDLFLKLQ